MIPRLAALSIEEISRRIWLGSGFSEEPARLCSVRRCVTTLRLRSDRRTVCRARLAADFVLAIFSQATGRAGSRTDDTLSSRHGGDAGQVTLQVLTSSYSKAPNSKFQHPEKPQTSIFNSVIHARQFWSFKDLKFLWSLNVAIWNFEVCTWSVHFAAHRAVPPTNRPKTRFKRRGRMPLPAVPRHSWLAARPER